MQTTEVSNIVAVSDRVKDQVFLFNNNNIAQNAIECERILREDILPIIQSINTILFNDILPEYNIVDALCVNDSVKNVGILLNHTKHVLTILSEGLG